MDFMSKIYYVDKLLLDVIRIYKSHCHVNRVMLHLKEDLQKTRHSHPESHPH